MGLLNLPIPLAGDQALFLLGARAINHGALLYRDFWDLKQPGIYCFYFTAGKVFGFNSVGVRLAEIVWFELLAAVICLGLRRRTGASPAITAIITVGTYFSVCGCWDLTQLEGLVWLPMVAALLLVIGPDRRFPTKGRWLAFGAMAGVIALFKLMLIAVPIGFAVVALWPGRKGEEPTTGWRQSTRALAIAAAGVAVVWLPPLVYFAREHQLGTLWQTFVIDPPRIVSQMPGGRLPILLRSEKWFVLAAGPLLALDLIALLKRQRPDRYEATLVIWALLAAALVLAQRMWWEYHFLLILCPVCLMAAIGFGRLWRRLKAVRQPGTRRVLTAGLVLLTLGPFAGRLIFRSVAEIKCLSDANPAVKFAGEVSPSYSIAATEAGWLNASIGVNENVYVLGDPLILLLADRPQPVAINGWSPEWLLPEQWDELARQIYTARPKAIFVAAENSDILYGNGRALQRIIQSNYRPARSTDVGVWYMRNSD